MTATLPVTVGWYDRGLDDDAAICDLHQRIRAWQVATGQNHDFGDDSRIDLSDITAHYLERGGNFWVARLPDRTPVGMVGLIRVDRYTAKGQRFAVAPEYQGQGIGTRLMAEFIAYAESMSRAAYRPIRRVIGGTGENECGLPIYKRFGFRVVGWDDQHRDHRVILDVPRQHRDHRVILDVPR